MHRFRNHCSLWHDRQNASCVISVASFRINGRIHAGGGNDHRASACEYDTFIIGTAIGINAIAAAINIQISAAAKIYSRFGIALGIQLHQLDPVGGDEGHKGNKVFLGHGVVDGDEMLVLHSLHGDGMIPIRFFRLQSRQRDAAAADHGTAGGRRN